MVMKRFICLPALRGQAEARAWEDDGEKLMRASVYHAGTKRS